MKTLLDMIEAYATACETHGFYDGQLEMDMNQDAEDVRNLQTCEKKKRRAKAALMKFIGFNTGVPLP